MDGPDAAELRELGDQAKRARLGLAPRELLPGMVNGAGPGNSNGIGPGSAQNPVPIAVARRPIVPPPPAQHTTAPVYFNPTMPEARRNRMDKSPTPETMTSRRQAML